MTWNIKVWQTCKKKKRNQEGGQHFSHHCIYIYIYTVPCLFHGNWTYDLCAVNTMLYHWATGFITSQCYQCVFRFIIVKLLSSNLFCVNTISRGENQKGVRDISPTLQEGQNKNAPYFELILIIYNKDVYTHGWQYICEHYFNIYSEFFFFLSHMNEWCIYITLLMCIVIHSKPVDAGQ